MNVLGRVSMAALRSRLIVMLKNGNDTLRSTAMSISLPFRQQNCQKVILASSGAISQHLHLLDMKHQKMNIFTRENIALGLALPPPETVVRKFSDDSSLSQASKKFNFIADAAEIAAPAVCYVEVKIKQPGLFGAEMEGSGAGSGFIVTDYGIIITNAHVVNSASNVGIKLPSGEIFKGEILDMDPIADLAIVKINPDRKLQTVKLGNSATVRPGEWVVALGSPLNLSNTVTAGIVSAVHRGGKDLGLRKGDMKYIQTDAPINRGNSGGPLINLDGEVIGINTMTLLNTTGISFAVPIDRAKAFLLQSLEKHERQSLTRDAKPTPSRAYIGIKMMTLAPEIQSQLRQQMQEFPDVHHGVLVVDVVHGSPAFRAGLRPYDVIIEIDGVIVSTSEQLHEFVSRGRDMNATVMRGSNQRQMLRITPVMI